MSECATNQGDLTLNCLKDGVEFLLVACVLCYVGATVLPNTSHDKATYFVYCIKHALIAWRPSVVVTGRPVPLYDQ